MKLGFLSACMPERSLEQVVAWAAINGYEALELAAWPRLGDRPFTASHLDVVGFDEGDAERVLELLQRHGLTLSALAYYDNNLDPDPAERAAHHAHVRACVDAAALLGGVRSGPSSGAIRAARSPRTCARPSASCHRWSTTPASAACGS